MLHLQSFRVIPPNLIGKSNEILVSGPFFALFSIFLILIRRKENDIIRICSRHFGIEKNPFPISHIDYGSCVKKLQNSVGILISCFRSREIFQKFSDQHFWNLEIRSKIPSSAAPRNWTLKSEFPSKPMTPKHHSGPALP